MRTIVVATQKGGSGKSTLAMGLAVAAQQAGEIVRLIETDPQGTLSYWQSRRGLAEPFVEPIHAPADIGRRLDALARGGVTLVVIDTSSGINALTRAAIDYADLCLVPARPCIADIVASAPTVKIIRNSRRRFAFVLNQAPHRGPRASEAARALIQDDIADIIATPLITLRNDHQDALAAGLGVTEFHASGKSADEICLLWQWVEQRLPRADASYASDPADVESHALLANTAAAMPTEATLSWDACL
ncbi:AAA family ATPase [Bradyrhizobium sp. HKCCYLS3077]|uniref:nucleotide-binding protein n=1 Tax=Bradyrhizobium sp. HKCCYLS3077 TaxID=3420761 RepID=UPI003EBF6742